MIKRPDSRKQFRCKWAAFPARRGVAAFVLGVLCTTYCVFLFLLRDSLDVALALYSDDAFYYFKIAHNISSGVGCTFDGIARTNGFHPLWLGCLLPVFWLTGAHLELPVRIMTAVSGALCVGTLVLVYEVSRKHIGPNCGLVAVAACLLTPVFGALLNGMETGLLLFGVAVMLWLCYEKRIHDPLASGTSSLLFGIVLGVIALCRLDSVFLLFAALCLGAVAYPVLKVPVRTCISRLLTICVGFGAAVGPYLAWNLLLFKHVVPISGAVKSSFPRPRDGLLELPGDMLIGAALLGVLVGLTGLVIGRRSESGRARAAVRSPLMLITLASIFHLAYEYLFVTWGVYWWHFSVYGLGIALASGEAVGALTTNRVRFRPWLVGVAVVGTLALAIPINGRVIAARLHRHRQWLAAAEWARHHTPSDAVFAIKDAGLFGYFADRHVVNLDGKANSYEYKKCLEEAHVDRYLRLARVSYVADISARYQAGRSRIVIPRAGQDPVILWTEKAREVYRSATRLPTRSGREVAGYFTIWAYAEPVGDSIQ